MAGFGDALPVDFWQAIDEVVAFGRWVLGSFHLLRRQPEVLSKVDDFYTFGDVVCLHERLALAVAETEEDHVDLIERHVGRKLQVSIAIKSLMHGRHVVAGVAFAVGKDDGGLWMIDQQTYELATCITGGAEYSYSYHFSSLFLCLDH